MLNIKKTSNYLIIYKIMARIFLFLLVGWCIIAGLDFVKKNNKSMPYNKQALTSQYNGYIVLEKSDVFKVLTIQGRDTILNLAVYELYFDKYGVGDTVNEAEPENVYGSY